MTQSPRPPRTGITVVSSVQCTACGKPILADPIPVLAVMVQPVPTEDVIRGFTATDQGGPQRAAVCSAGCAYRWFAALFEEAVGLRVSVVDGLTTVEP